MVIPMLFKYFAKILIYHRLKDKSQAASALGVNPYFLNDYVGAAKNYSQGKLLENIHILRDYDMRSKGYGATNNLSDGDLYKELLFRLVAG
jgi:DNA polymerase-3 subunit delta